MTAEDIAAKTPLTKKYTEFVSSWECTDYTVLRCMQALGGALLRADLIDVRSLELLGKFNFFHMKNSIRLYYLIFFRLNDARIIVPEMSKVHSQLYYLDLKVLEY